MGSRVTNRHKKFEKMLLRKRKPSKNCCFNSFEMVKHIRAVRFAFGLHRIGPAIKMTCILR